MDFLALQTAILDDFSVTTTDIFYTAAIIKRAINRSYKWVAAQKPWPDTEEAYWMDVDANGEWYNYPTTFKTDSVRRVKVNSITYDKINFNDYLQYKEDNGTGATDKVFADFQRKIFVSPAPIAAVTQGAETWGQVIPTALSADADQSLFYGTAEVEEIIIKKAQAFLYKKGRGKMYDRGIELDAEVLAEIEIAWKQIQRKEADYKAKNNPTFKTVQVLPPSSRGGRGRRGSTTIGNF